jgi:hypothetical protein
MSIIILDLDNCIADDRHRIPHIRWKMLDPDRRYHDYHMLSAWDEPGNHDLWQDTPHDIVVFTARPVAFSTMTREWLRRQGIRPREILMRNPNDHRPSVALKRTQLLWLTSYYGVKLTDIAAAYDDRLDVVEMYRDRGLHAEVRAIHDLCAYTRPQETT